MKYLITGGAGFIGSHLCSKLAKEGNEVLAIDNFSDYYAVELKNLRVDRLLKPLKIRVLNLDIRNKDQVHTIINSSKPDIVINLAAQAGVRLPINQIHNYVENNLVGFSNVLQATVLNEIPLFMYASSSSVYGNNAPTPYTESEPNLHPNSFYGATKLANEILAKTLVEGTSTKARGLRFFSVYGPWGRPDMAYFRMIANVLTGSDFNFFGDGSIERDFTFITDAIDSVCELIRELKNRRDGFSDFVNIGGGKPVSIDYLMKIIGELGNKSVVFTRKVENKNDVTKTMADTQYLQTLINFKPTTELKFGITETLNWAKSSEIALRIHDWVNSVAQ